MKIFFRKITLLKQWAILSSTLFQKNHLAQTMGPIVLYTHAKNWEDPLSCFGEKAKNHYTDGLRDRRRENNRRTIQQTNGRRGVNL